MKYKFGSLVVNGTGKIGGQVVSKNAYGTYAKNKVSPKNNQTARQLFVRANMAFIVSAWEGLSEVNRLAWNAYASDYYFKNKLGDSIVISGFNMFTKCNLVRLNESLSILSTPVLPSVFPVLDFINGSAFSLGPAIYLFLYGLNSSDFSIHVYATPVLSPGKSNFSGSYYFIGSFPADGNYPLNVYTAYSSVFTNELTTGYKISIKVILVHKASGMVSGASIKNIVIEDGYSSTAFQTWGNSISFSGETRLQSGITLSSGSVLIGTGVTGKIYRSTDNGLTFTGTSQLYSQTYITRFVEISNGIVFALCGSTGRLLKSIDDGITWIDLGRIFSSAYLYDLIELPDGSLLLCQSNNGAIYQSYDFGITWVNRLYLGASGKILYSIEKNGSLILASGYQMNGFYKSLDNGKNWSYFSITPTITRCSNLLYVGNNIWLAFTGDNGLVLRSIDNGSSWVSVYDSSISLNITDCCYIGNGVIIASGGSTFSIIISYDYGLTWSPINNSSSYNSAICVFKLNSTSVLIGTFNTGILLKLT